MRPAAFLPVICSIVLIMFYASPALSFDNQFEKELKVEAQAVKLLREVEQGGYEIITTAELNNLLDGCDNVLVIDTMPFETSYKKAHIPGADNFVFPIEPMKTWDTSQAGGQTQEDFKALLGSDRDKTIVIYCGFVTCARSHNGAIWARKLGYRNVYRHPGGIFAWKGAGYKTETVSK